MVALASLLCFLGGQSASGQAPVIPVTTDYRLTTWQRDDGLPHSTVSAIAQTRAGYLWIGTHEGLTRFYGVEFEHYPARTTPGLASDYIECLTADTDGTLWIGLERGGVARWKEGTFEALAPLSSYSNRVYSLTRSGPGEVWAGLSNGRIMRFKNGRWETLGANEGFPARGRVVCHADTDGRTWFASHDSFGYFEDDAIYPLTTNRREFFSVAPRRDGGVWLRRGGTLQRFGTDLKPLTVTRQMAQSTGFLQAFYEDSSGTLWMGTRGNGLYRFRNGVVERVPTSHDFIISVCEDTEGNLWVGTWGGGLNRLRPRVLKIYGREDGLPRSLISSICEDAQGRLWIAARNAPPVTLSPARDEVVTHSEGWTPAYANVVCADSSGGVWLAAVRNGLFHWTNGVYKPADFQDTFITSVFEDSRTNLWVGTLRAGLFQWRNGTATRVSRSADFREITAITEDATESIWVGTQKGTLHHRQPGEAAFTRFDVTPGPPGVKITVLYSDGPGRLWIGTRGEGLIRMKNGQFSRITTADGLPDNDIRQILQDDYQRLWVASSRGLFRAGAANLEAVANGTEATVDCLLLGPSYGLANFEFQEGFGNGMCRSRDGHLWFATTRGVVEVTPAADTTPVAPPPVHIDKLLLDGKALAFAPGSSVQIPPAPGRVDFHFTAPSYTAPENVMFRHRLEPLEQDWTKAGAERTATYLRIPPGNYRFRVMARGSSGTWNRVGASIRFTVHPTLLQTSWFRVLLIAGAAIIIALTIRLTIVRRMRRRVRELEQAYALENERRRIARDMHDDLGARLTRLALMSEQTRTQAQLDPETGDRIRRISKAANDVAHSLDQIVWTVNPRNDTLDRLIGYLSEYTSTYLADTNMELTQELPEHYEGYRIDSHVRHELFLTFKEALNNAVKHSAATQLSLHIWLEGHTLHIELADNGRGFAPEECKERGDGLANLEQRLHAVGGVCRVETEPGKGTRVALTLPLLQKRSR
jgi:ligand-binding sensor domain-containing protein/signal transduction histidine kinase